MRNNVVLLCAFLVFVGSLGTFTIDMYVPALPDIANSLGSTTTAVKLTITLYLASYAVGTLIYGALVDCFGRKRVMLLAIVLGLIGCLCCSFATQITWFSLGRFLQGAGFAAIGVAAPAVARDLLTQEQFAQVGSILSMLFGLGVILSPILGGYVVHWWGWRMIFVLLSVYAVITLLAICVFLQETHAKGQRQRFQLGPILKRYGEVMVNPVFFKNTTCKSIAYTGFIIFYAVTPFMLQERLGLSVVQYGWVTLGLTGVVLLSKLVNTFLLRWVAIETIIIMATIVLGIGSLSLLVFALLHQYSFMAIMLPFVVFGFGSGFLFSNATVVAYKPFSKAYAGSVAGLLAGTQLACAFVGSAIAAHLDESTLMPLAILMVVLSAVAVGVYVVLRPQSS